MEWERGQSDVGKFTEGVYVMGNSGTTVNRELDIVYCVIFFMNMSKM